MRLFDIQDITQGVAKVVAGYRSQLRAEGMSDAEAWALAQRMEERLLGPVYDAAEAELQPAPWADIEALFVAVVNLQLVMGQMPEPWGAVRYMASAGVHIPQPTAQQCRQLAGRTVLAEDAVRRAFETVRLETLDRRPGADVGSESK